MNLETIYKPSLQPAGRFVNTLLYGQRKAYKKMAKQLKEGGTEQSVEDFCEESFDGETNVKSLIIKSEIIVGCKALSVCVKMCYC